MCWPVLTIWQAASACAMQRVMNDDGIRQQLEILRIEHRDMDAAISALQEKPMLDQLQIARLKRKKLGLKDRIMQMEDQLVPDIIA